MVQNNDPIEDPWAVATFEGNEREQLRRWAKMTFTEKVRWLEEAHRLSMKFEATRLARNAQEGRVRT
jgi:hypothetical protein